MVEKCVLCKTRFPNDKLYSACRCYKKSDSNRLHKSCLASVYANKETDELPRCPTCGDIYRVSVKYNFMFAWHRFLSCRSLSHTIEMVVIVMMIMCGGFVLYVFQHSPEYLEHQKRLHRLQQQQLLQQQSSSSSSSPSSSNSHIYQEDSHIDIATYVIYLLFGITICLVPFTMKKVYERWRTANSDVEVDIV